MIKFLLRNLSITESQVISSKHFIVFTSYLFICFHIHPITNLVLNGDRWRGWDGSICIKIKVNWIRNKFWTGHWVCPPHYTRVYFGISPALNVFMMWRQHWLPPQKNPQTSFVELRMEHGRCFISIHPEIDGADVVANVDYQGPELARLSPRPHNIVSKWPRLIWSQLSNFDTKIFSFVLSGGTKRRSLEPASSQPPLLDSLFMGNMMGM